MKFNILKRNQKTRMFILYAFLALTLSTVSPDSYAADKEIIATVDSQEVAEKSTAVQKIKEQLEKKSSEFNKEWKQKEEYFKKKYAELEKQKSVLSKEAQDKQSDDLSKEFSDAQKKHIDNQKILEKAYTEAMQQVDKTFNEIVKEEATKQGVKIVFYKVQLIYSDLSLDITSKIIEGLNKKLPNVTVKFG